MDFDFFGGFVGLFHLESRHIRGIEIVAPVDNDIIGNDGFILVQLGAHIFQQREFGFGVVDSFLRTGILSDGSDHEQRSQQQRRQFVGIVLHI